MNLDDAAEKLLKRKDADEIEVYIHSSNSMFLEGIGKKVEKRAGGFNAGAAIRVIKDKKIGFQYFTDPNFAEQAFDNALKLSKFSKSADYFFPNEKVIATPKLFSSKISEMSTSDAFDILKSAVSTVYDNKSEVISSNFIVENNTVRLMNNNGLDVGEKANGIYLELATKYENGTDSEGTGARELFDPTKLAEMAADYAKLMNRPRKIANGNYTIVLDQHAILGLLDEMLLPQLDGDMARRKISLFLDKDNEQVFPEILTVKDVSNAPGLLGSFSFDGDGFPSSEKYLFDRGVFKGFVYDMCTAAKAGKKSTGNAARSGYSTDPNISLSNISVSPGKGLDSDNYILLHEFMGSHTLDPISGDFSILFDVAFLVENGEINSSLRQTMLSSNIFEFFKKLTAIDKKPEVLLNLISPKMQFSNVFLSGG